MIKRLFDVVVSVLAFLLLAPVILATGILIWNKLGSPIIFSQTRPGLGGKPFNMLKFRSMLDVCDEHGTPLPNAQRMTHFGKILRSTSLDELPGLWNVFKGDMSLVGPRPLLMEYLPLYDEFQKRRHEVKPGITGWAQVNGRNAISWEQKFNYDVWYVDHRTFWLDLKILFLTVKKVFIREGISHGQDVAMPRFEGSKR